MQQVEVIDLLRVIWRWSWLIIGLSIVVVGVLFFQQRGAENEYEAQVTLFVSTPDRQDVATSDEYTFTDNRDLITSAINTFVQVAQYNQVKRRTLASVGNTDNYRVSAHTELGADFVYITVYASTPQLARQLADAHAANAISYFGELRALPAQEALTFFTTELATARQAFVDAQNALVDFQIEHDIISLDTEMSIAEKVLEERELAYASLLLPSASMPSTTVASQTDLLSLRNSLESQRTRIAELSRLKPDHDLLVEELSKAQTNYIRLLDSVADTELRRSFASKATFIQIIEPAELRRSPDSTMVRTLILGGVGGLGLGIPLAFVLDYFKRRR